MDKGPFSYRFPDGTPAWGPLSPRDIERWEARKREREFRLKQDLDVHEKVKNKPVDHNFQFKPELEFPATPPELRTETEWKSASATKKARERCCNPKRKT
jgi:hypothetical protein